MGQSRLNEEQEFLVCDDCDAEFSVVSAYEDNEAIAFCPYCGSPFDIDDDDLDDEEELDEDYRN